jgi:hypothetical protein
MKTLDAIFLCACFVYVCSVQATNSCAPQSAEGRFCQSLIAGNQLNHAALELQRLRFFNNPDTICCMQQMAWASFYHKKFSHAEALFEQLFSASMPGSLQQKEATTGLVYTFCMQGKTALAQQEITTPQNQDSCAALTSQHTLLAGIISAASFQTDSARQQLAPLCADARYSPMVNQLDTLFTWYQSQQFKNPVSAYVFSSALPGAGHLYNGNKKKAGASMALMAGLGTVIGISGYQFYKGDARGRLVAGMDIFLVSSLLWRRYYNSIRKASYESAVQQNKNIQAKYLVRLHAVIAAPHATHGQHPTSTSPADAHAHRP